MTQDTTASTLDDATQAQKPFTLRYAGPGKAEVLLDGEDITSQLRGVHIDAVAPDPAYVVLELSPKADGVLFEGLARIAIGEQPDPGPAAAHFLAAIDAAELERVALNRQDLDPTEPASLTAAMLRQLQDWANGRS